MKNMPRILPLVGVAAVGVLAVNGLSGARSLPDMVSATRAFAEGAADKVAPGKGDKPTAKAEDKAPAATADKAKPLVAACGASPEMLAKEAGLSPAELNILQSLRQRSGQLDQREQDMDVQLKLLAAAEAKLDAKVKALNAVKGDIQGLLGQAESRQAAEIDRMVTVYSAMKPKDAAARLSVLDDAVRLPIAAKMKERSLSMVLASMPPAEAKKLTESLAKRFADTQAVLDGKAAVAPEPAKPAQKADAAAAPAAQPKKSG